MTGAAKGTHCSICNDPRAAAINAAINGGVSDRRVQADFGLSSRSKVMNHRKAQHPGVEPPDAPPAPEFRPVEGTARDKLQNLIDHMEAQAATAEGGRRVDVMRELRIAYEKLYGMTSGGEAEAVSWRDVEGLPELIEAWAAALEPFPEARLTMLKVLEDRGWVPARKEGQA